MADLQARLQAAIGDAFRIEQELGGGGMSRVFLAQERELERRVVVKVLPSEMAAGVNAERFRREIQLAASLQHPHIVPLLAAGHADDLLYYTMPLIEGESLRAKLAREGELPIPETVRVLRDVADALAYAHEHGVVHRDIKPDNVLIAHHHAVVTDFGVAKALSESTGKSSLTSAGVALGTPAYMAPEQAAADPHTDHRCDIYAMGALGYEMLTGRPPFTGATPQHVLAAHVTEAPEPVTKRRGAVPPALAALVMRCLEKSPADRWQTADEVLAQLDAMSTPSGGTTPTAAIQARPLRRRVRAIRYALSVVVLVAVGGATAYWRWSHRGARAAGDMAATGKSLAVLAFVNVGGDTANEYFSDGMTDELTAVLGKVPGLRVASRTSAFAFKGKSDLDVRDVGRRLNVGAVLEGTVRRAGDRLRVSAQLTNVADGLTLWSETYERRLTDVFSVQEDIAQAITGPLQLTLAGGAQGRIASGGTENLRAHDPYLRGRFFYNKFTEADLRRSLSLFEQALAADSNYARAWAGIADVWNWLADDWVAPREAYPKARAAAQRALSLDSTLAEAHAAHGAVLMWYDWDLAAAEREYQRALALNPNYAVTYEYYSAFLRALGRPDSAIAIADRAELLDPLAPLPFAYEGLVLVDVGRYDRAIEQCRKALELDPTFSLAFICIGDAQLLQGHAEEALSTYCKAPEFGVRGRVSIAIAEARLGHMIEARRLVDQLVQESHQRYVRADWIGFVYAHLGDLDAAFRWFDKGYEARSAGMILLKTNWRWAPVRSDPRFAALAKRVGIP